MHDISSVSLSSLFRIRGVFTFRCVHRHGEAEPSQQGAVDTKGHRAPARQNATFTMWVQGVVVVILQGVSALGRAIARPMREPSIIGCRRRRVGSSVARFPHQVGTETASE